jgi:hypothetical protein
MNLIDLRIVLEPLGWQFDGSNLVSPSGGYWISESTLLEPLAKVYPPVARRREMALREGRPDAHEYDALVRALEADLSISILASQVRTMGELVTAWAKEHSATVSLWELNLPAARATARHPFGGMACIECELENTGAVSVTVMHWRDDHSSGIRSLWMRSLSPCDLFVTPLAASLDDAVRLLLEPHDITSYKHTDLASGNASLVALAQAWENGFGILH